jgi:sugar-specific transcriptional regulator TrmB
MQEYEINEFLEKLGLTEYEAKTLSSLFKLKEAEAPEISRSAQVPKTRVYDVLDRLTSKKLVIEIHGRPKRYMAIEPSEVFKILIAEKKKEIAELEKKSEELKNMIMTEKQPSKHEKVMKVKDKNDFIKILGQEIESANQSIHALTTLEKEHTGLKDSVRKLAGKNVDIKIIASINESSSKLVRDFTESGAKIKDYNHGMTAYIIDGKKVIMALSDFQTEKPEYHFTIWPENKALANALMKFFDHAWEQGKEISIPQTKTN